LPGYPEAGAGFLSLARFIPFSENRSVDSSLGPLEEINRVIRENRVGDYRSPNLALGMRPMEFGRGSARWSWEVQPPLALNPFGTLQGGYLALFVDELLSTAIGSVLETGEWAVTAEMKLSYLRALRPGALAGSARVIRRSRALAFLEASIAADGQEPAVLATSTWAISR
jgi:uncharacterized protein (TIGR00369 family)